MNGEMPTTHGPYLGGITGPQPVPRNEILVLDLYLCCIAQHESKRVVARL
jgi:hypothetical protein